MKSAKTFDYLRIMRHKESTLQSHCVKWFRFTYPTHILFAIPNGGQRSRITGAIMKAEGVLAGVADLFLAYPNGKFAGLFIEMKTEDGRQQPTQKEFEEKIKAAGYEYALCHSFEEFTITVNDYLNDEYYNGESDYYTTTAR